MTHSELCIKTARWLVKTKRWCHWAVAEPNVAFCNERPDVYGATLQSCLIAEIKRSRTDFLKERQKTAWLYCDYFYYVTYGSFVELGELDSNSGLIELRGDKFYVIKKALNRNSHYLESSETEKLDYMHYCLIRAEKFIKQGKFFSNYKEFKSK